MAKITPEVGLYVGVRVEDGSMPLALDGSFGKGFAVAVRVGEA